MKAYFNFTNKQLGILAIIKRSIDYLTAGAAGAAIGNGVEEFGWYTFAFAVLTGIMRLAGVVVGEMIRLSDPSVLGNANT